MFNGFLIGFYDDDFVFCCLESTDGLVFDLELESF